MLVTIAFVVIATFGVQSLAFDQFLRVDSVILRRPDYRSLRATAARRVQAHDDIPALLTELCGLLAPAMSARAVTWHEWSGFAEDLGSSVVAVGDSALRVVNALAVAADHHGGEARRPAAAVL